MKIKGLKPRKVNSGLGDVPIVVAFESETGRLVPKDEFNGFCVAFLSECGIRQKELIASNVEELPQRVLTGAIRPLDFLNEGGKQEPLASHLQKNISNS